MAADFVGCWIVEKICKYLFAVHEPKEMITRGWERRIGRRQKQEQERKAEAAAKKEE